MEIVSGGILPVGASDVVTPRVERDDGLVDSEVSEQESEVRVSDVTVDTREVRTATDANRELFAKFVPFLMKLLEVVSWLLRGCYKSNVVIYLM